MADTDQEDRTEAPTQRRLDQAIERGDVAKSPEVSTFLALAAATLALTMSAGSSSRNLTVDLAAHLANSHLVPDDPTTILATARRALLAGLAALAAPVGLVLAAALAAGLSQHRLVWSVEALAPKFSRVSPAAGFARIFGKQSFANFVKSLAKLVFVGLPAGLVMWGERDRLEALIDGSAQNLLSLIWSLSLKMLGAILIAHAFLAIGDYAFARYTWMQRQRMSKEELKQENKEQEGNPEIKAQIRKLRSQRLRKRMMAAVPGATVVVTNPTHYAVALRYEKGMPAPICVAKGVDVIAARIRAVAAENDVPVIENPPLARALHATVEIDGEIPVEHYKAVAEVIGFVLRLRRRAS